MANETKKTATKKVATKPAAKTTTKKVAAKPDTKTTTKKVAAKPAAKTTTKKVAAKPAAKTTTKVATKPAAKTTTKAAAKPATKTTKKVATKPVVAKVEEKPAISIEKTETKDIIKAIKNEDINLSMELLLQLNKEINNTAIFVQAILVSSLIILGICTIFIPAMSFVTEIMLALALFVMAYNNYITFKRKGFTIAYLIVGLIVITIGIIAKVYGI